MVLKVDTDGKRQVLDITDKIEDRLEGSGLVNIFVQHTTAAVTTADLDPGGTDKDYLEAITAMTPDKSWRHPHDPGHFPDHLWSSLIGPGLSVPFEKGKLQLGTWQRIVLIEFDGPREREIRLTAILN
ncbi:MAG TPA: secondary thiamine-phosphate synthase enzyme YjbQ [Candidatus Saccharimonadales bacterium]|nr:secondary thiamine-phosphate synthase enzyme YjbQ [Candidatus Saccharimonadales bacterium]